MSRQTDKTPELTEKIIQLVLAGNTLSKICERPDMPNRRTVHRWLQDDDEFSKAYFKAVKMRSHELIGEALEIADKEKGSLKDVAADRLRIGTRLRLAAVLNPNLFAKRTVTKKARSKEDPLTKVIVEIVRGDQTGEEGQDTNQPNDGSAPAITS